MISPGGDRDGRDGVPSRTSSVGVLADRIAAALIHHEPGWRLPRLTALARRYNVSAAEVDAAIEELAVRHLLRRLPDGQVYRASPAECQVPLAGLTGLLSRVDPMGGELACQRRQVSTRRVPEDVGRALGLSPGDSVMVIRCLWLVGGEPGALSATYVPSWLGSLAGDFSASPLPEPGGAAGQQPDWAAEDDGPGWPGEDGEIPADAGTAAPAGQRPAGEDVGPAATDPSVDGRPCAVQIELGPPPPSVARSLRLGAGQPVATVTVLFEEPSGQKPVALTVAMLRPDLFRIVVEAADVPSPAAGGDGSGSAWTHAAEGWEP